MKLGLFDHMQKHDNPGRSYVDLYKNHLDVVEFADQAGMDFYFVAEHHFDMGFPSVRAPAVFSVPLPNELDESVWAHWSMSCRCGTPSGSPKKSRCSTT